MRTRGRSCVCKRPRKGEGTVELTAFPSRRGKEKKKGGKLHYLCPRGENTIKGGVKPKDKLDFYVNIHALSRLVKEKEEGRGNREIAIAQQRGSDQKGGSAWITAFVGAKGRVI